MNTKILTHETPNNTYYIGYGKTAKTSYEQQQANREQRRYMIMQKSLGIAFILLGFILTAIDSEFAVVLIFTTLIGLAVTLTNDRVIVF